MTQSKTFIVLVRPAFEAGVIYQPTSIEVHAKNWDEAYKIVRESNCIPLVDELESKRKHEV